MNTPNIIVFDGGNQFTTAISSVGASITSYDFNDGVAITSGTSGTDSVHSGYFYICNKSTDNEASRSLVNPVLSLTCTKCGSQTVASALSEGYNHIKVYKCTPSSKTGTALTTNEIKEPISIQSASGNETLEGAANNATLDTKNYSMIRIEASPQANAGAGDYTYTLSIKGTYT